MIHNVGSNWVPVTLPVAYVDMVVVASVAYDDGDLPAVVRVRNAFNNGFELRVQNPGDINALSGYTVSYLVVEAGQYTQATDGVTFEAVKVTSTATDRRGSWIGQAESYTNTYTNPVVIGQVMTENDMRWSTFWSFGVNRFDAPTASYLNVSKHVGEDSDIVRADETLGYLVFEAGTTVVGTLVIKAGVGSDTVRGIDNGGPYAYPVGASNGTAIASQTNMDGGDGAWAVLAGDDALSGGTLRLNADEDQVRDSERRHATEQVAYVIVDNFVPPEGP